MWSSYTVSGGRLGSGMNLRGSESHSVSSGDKLRRVVFCPLTNSPLGTGARLISLPARIIWLFFKPQVTLLNTQQQFSPLAPDDGNITRRDCMTASKRIRMGSGGHEAPTHL